MNFNPQDIATIDRYLRNEMEADERAAFEQRLHAEPDLRKEVEDMKVMSEALRLDSLKEKKKMLEDYEEELDDRKYNHFGFNWKWSIAATILLIIGAYLIWPRDEQVPKHEQLFAQYMEIPELDVSGVRSGGEEPESVQSANYKFASNNYIIGQYEVAAPALEKVYEEEQDTLMLLYAGIAYLADDQVDKALEIFDRIEEWPEEMKDDVLWYKALSNLRNAKIDEVRNLISKIFNPEQFNAETLLEKLE